MRYLIFGGTGSLGKKLIERLLPQHSVAVYSRDEAKHWTIRNELAGGELATRSKDGLKFFVGDIRDQQRVKETIRQYNPSIIIVAAALKQVDTCELSPSEAVLTNLTGTQNVVNAVNELAGRELTSGVKVLFVSTDKACAPVNVYGMCKSISERIVSSQQNSHVKFLCVRYGNVLESRGSIIPLFKFQAENADHLTVTDPEMTRFVMTLDDSVNLIQETLVAGLNGETWIPKLPAMKIGDLAQIFSELSNKAIKIIGLRPGEKLHEDLINESESVRTRIHEKLKSDPANLIGHYVIKSAAHAENDGKRFTYSSSDRVMSKAQLMTHLKTLGMLDMPLDKFVGTSIEEIVTNRK